MATSKEFNRLYDLGVRELEKLERAEHLAFGLGYSANYCDGMACEDYDFCVEEINNLVGKEWPESVKNAYKDGADLGYWET